MSTFFPTEVLSSKIPLASLASTLPTELRLPSMRDFSEDVRHDESNTRGGS
ncbi:hypothetical protein ANCCEY_02490 [Ancylostoma ceylanicum]|uniref:Uncharacterized protein n=1 Tax=Ancylostoma ceylanicum TaxID=53326 RepID=A0A0D6M2T8_9BILA|nr:hypothetical protein ANCCEY_02490 [Ancylostoma ceylanicum]